MNLSTCVACRAPVLELEGQFELLDSYLVQGGAPPPESAGWWHLKCLRAADVGAAWSEARLKNYVRVRAYERIASLPGWTILRRSSERRALAIGRSGELFDFSRIDRARLRAVPGGMVAPLVEPAFHLELEDRALASEIQRSLDSSGSYALEALLKGLGIAERVAHPAALEGGALRFDAELREHWGANAVSARLEHGLFVPAELLAWLPPVAT